MSGPSEDWFAPPSGPPAPPQPGAQQPGAPRPYPPPPAATGGYPPDPYYAPGWAAPVSAAPPRRRSPGRRLWVPLAGLTVVGLLVAGVFGVRYWFESRPLGSVDSATSVLSARLDTGHCLESLPADGEVGQVTVVPCDEPHAAEVVGAREVPFTTWQGAKQAGDSLARWCEMDAVEQAAGFHAVIWAPSAQSWRQGDRTGLCLAALDAGTATGSFTAGDQVTTD